MCINQFLWFFKRSGENLFTRPRTTECPLKTTTAFVEHAVEVPNYLPLTTAARRPAVTCDNNIIVISCAKLKLLFYDRLRDRSGRVFFFFAKFISGRFTTFRACARTPSGGGSTTTMI